MLTSTACATAYAVPHALYVRPRHRMRYTCARGTACAIRAPTVPHALLHALPHALYARPQAVCVGPTELKHVRGED